MLDFSHIPSKAIDRQIFYTIGGSDTWQTWRKPRNAKIVHMFCIGGGGGGGGGGNNSGASHICAGGSGGGASGYSVGTYFASVLPDILYIQVGAGGAGALPKTTSGTGNGGTDGELSYISLAPTTSSLAIVLQSSGIKAQGGNGGTGNTSAATSQQVAGGAGGSVWSINSGFSKLGLVAAYSGAFGLSAGVPSGSAVPLSTVVTEVKIPALLSGIITGGGAGGGRNGSSREYNGASIEGVNIFFPSSTVLGGTPFERNGGNGIGNLFPFCGTGGAGGAGGAAADGGAGGNGFYGCGGGGGGATYNVYTARAGGNGGDGIVIITTST